MCIIEKFEHVIVLVEKLFHFQIRIPQIKAFLSFTAMKLKEDETSLAYF